MTIYIRRSFLMRLILMLSVITRARLEQTQPFLSIYTVRAVQVVVWHRIPGTSYTIRLYINGPSDRLGDHRFPRSADWLSRTSTWVSNIHFTGVCAINKGLRTSKQNAYYYGLVLTSSL